MESGGHLQVDALELAHDVRNNMDTSEHDDEVPPVVEDVQVMVGLDPGPGSAVTVRRRVRTMELPARTIRT
eukprot:255230-Hanusia_phi.AAC.1